MTQSEYTGLLADYQQSSASLPFRVERGTMGDGWEVVAVAASLAAAISAYFTALREFPGHPFALRQGDRVLASSEDQMASDVAALREQARKPPRLTKRDSEVLRLLMTGLSMKQVAARLGISSRTVAFHKYKVMKENDLHSNAELFRFIMGLGLLASK